ncbi:MAG: hypothetical protein DRJ52_04415 [Thermoprotei archaeon]|nr:MAG: hypothetical protein DRJ52_04415 [Thermoprotei archaeon]
MYKKNEIGGLVKKTFTGILILILLLSYPLSLSTAYSKPKYNTRKELEKTLARTLVNTLYGTKEISGPLFLPFFTFRTHTLGGGVKAYVLYIILPAKNPEAKKGSLSEIKGERYVATRKLVYEGVKETVDTFIESLGDIVFYGKSVDSAMGTTIDTLLKKFEELASKGSLTLFYLPYERPAFRVICIVWVETQDIMETAVNILTEQTLAPSLEFFNILCETGIEAIKGQLSLIIDEKLDTITENIIKKYIKKEGPEITIDKIEVKKGNITVTKYIVSGKGYVKVKKDILSLFNQKFNEIKSSACNEKMVEETIFGSSGKSEDIVKSLIKDLINEYIQILIKEYNEIYESTITDVVGTSTCSRGPTIVDPEELKETVKKFEEDIESCLNNKYKKKVKYIKSIVNSLKQELKSVVNKTLDSIKEDLTEYLSSLADEASKALEKTLDEAVKAGLKLSGVGTALYIVADAINRALQQAISGLEYKFFMKGALCVDEGKIGIVNEWSENKFIKTPWQDQLAHGIKGAFTALCSFFIPGSDIVLNSIPVIVCYDILLNNQTYTPGLPGIYYFNLSVKIRNKYDDIAQWFNSIKQNIESKITPLKVNSFKKTIKEYISKANIPHNKLEDYDRVQVDIPYIVLSPVAILDDVRVYKNGSITTRYKIVYDITSLVGQTARKIIGKIKKQISSLTEAKEILKQINLLKEKLVELISNKLVEFMKESIVNLMYSYKDKVVEKTKGMKKIIIATLADIFVEKVVEKIEELLENNVKPLIEQAVKQVIDQVFSKITPIIEKVAEKLDQVIEILKLIDTKLLAMLASYIRIPVKVTTNQLYVILPEIGIESVGGYDKRENCYIAYAHISVEKIHKLKNIHLLTTRVGIYWKQGVGDYIIVSDSYTPVLKYVPKIIKYKNGVIKIAFYLIELNTLIKKVNVVLIADGKEIQTTETDSKGIATFNINNLKYKTLEVKIIKELCPIGKCIKTMYIPIPLNDNQIIHINLNNYP